jgi:hypothetical protein
VANDDPLLGSSFAARDLLDLLLTGPSMTRRDHRGICKIPLASRCAAEILLNKSLADVGATRDIVDLSIHHSGERSIRVRSRPRLTMPWRAASDRNGGCDGKWSWTTRTSSSISGVVHR